MDSCYHCQYAQGERVSDITLADFWGLGELQTIERKSDRPSLILTNTPRGEAFFQLMKDRLWYEERTVQEAIDGNGRLNRSPGKSLEAKAFRAIYRVASFETAARWSVKAGDLAVAYHGLEKKLQTFSKRVKKAVLRRVKRKR